MDKKREKRLFYFTASFPYGLGETWKSNELKFFEQYFSEITIVPYSYSGNFTSPKDPGAGIKCEKPLFERDGITVNRLSFFKLFDKNFFYYINEFFNKKVYRNKLHVKYWLQASLQLKQLLKHPVIKNIARYPNRDTILYFFWGRGSCDFLPFIKKDAFGKTVVRFHRYDLFEDQNGGYIPYRKQLLQSVILAAPSSENGRQHMMKLYPDVANKIEVVRLGVISEGKVGLSRDNILRIFSCSYAVPVKRLYIICEALSCLSMPVEWTHVGDGPLMDDIKGKARHFPGNIKVNFPGMIRSEDVLGFYKRHTIDLFINVSSSEGVPFSIMESLSAGIPVFATNVGGTGEIIDDTVGKILDPDISGKQLAQLIEEFNDLTVENKITIRENAYNRYSERCDAEILARQFAEFLIQ